MANLAQVLDENSSNGKKIVEIYDQLGLTMYDANGQLLSGFDLLKQLASVWTKLDGNTQKYIATTLAGKIFAPSRLIAGKPLEPTNYNIRMKYT